MLCGLTLGLIVCTWVVAAPSMEEIRETVDANFASINSLYVTTVIHVNNKSIQGSVPSLLHHEWAFDEDGRIRHAFSSPSEPGAEAPPPMNQVVTFDGELAKGVGYANDDPSSQVFGSIFNEKAQYEHLISGPPTTSEFGRMWGKHIDGRGLPEWLVYEKAQISGTIPIEGVPCVVVDVPASGDVDVVYRFMLSIDHGYALKQHSIINAGKVTFTLMATRFREVEKDLWLPISGVVDPHGREGPHGPLSGYFWEVEQLQVNTELPGELFSIVFQEGVEVYDGRFGVPMKWEQGYDASTEDWARQLNDLSAQSDTARASASNDNDTQNMAPLGQTDREKREHSRWPSSRSLLLAFGGFVLLLVAGGVWVRGR